MATMMVAVVMAMVMATAMAMVTAMDSELMVMLMLMHVRTEPLEAFPCLHAMHLMHRDARVSDAAPCY